MDVGRIRSEVVAAVTQSPSVKRQVRAAAAEIRKLARQKAPVKSGNLRKNIFVENIYNPETRQVEYRVGWRKAAWYGSMVELGTEDTKAQPHLRPAADEVKRR